MYIVRDAGISMQFTRANKSAKFIFLAVLLGEGTSKIKPTGKQT